MQFFVLSIVATVLAQDGLSDSLPPFTGEGGEKLVCVYKDMNYKTDEHCYYTIDEQKAPYVNMISSIKIAPGCSVTVAAKNDKSDESVTFSTDVPDLRYKRRRTESRRYPITREPQGGWDDIISNLFIECSLPST